MNKFFSFVLAACLFCCGTMLNAQQTYHRCSSFEHLQDQLAADPALAERMQAVEQQALAYSQNNHSGSRSMVTIPVVVHVVYNTTAQNISDALIQAQINQLNLDYSKQNSDASSVPAAFSGLAANTNVQFCLAQRDPSGNATTGIVRKSTTVTSFSTNDAVKKSNTGGDDAWDATKYLNLWVCNLGGGLLGYAQFPGGAVATDGVVVLYSSVGSMTTPGSAAPYNYGRTATHEVGHWLNLYHIWGDDGTACTGSDNVGDTPNQAGENYGCPTFPTTDACSAASPGVMYMNYMDYTDDGCMNMFTAGQATRMNALFATGGARVGLLSSLGCQPVVVTGCGVPSGSTTGITTTAATLSWGTVANAVSYNYQWRAVGAATWNTGSTASTSVALSGLTQATNYEWQVQTVCSTSSSAFSSTVAFITATPSTCTDIYESNNTATAAKTPALNANLTGFITPSTDVDWFKFTTTTSGGTRVKVDLTNLPADYDVVLYQSNASTKLATGANSGTTSESIKYNTTSTGTYYVKVYGYNGATSATACYTLRISTSTSNFRTGETNGDETIAEAVAEPVLKLYPNPASNKLNVEYLSTAAGVAKLSVYNMNGQRVMLTEAEATEGMNTQSINTDALSNGVYIFEIYSNGETQRQKFTISK